MNNICVNCTFNKALEGKSFLDEANLFCTIHECNVEEYNTCDEFLSAKDVEEYEEFIKNIIK